MKGLNNCDYLNHLRRVENNGYKEKIRVKVMPKFRSKGK